MIIGLCWRCEHRATFHDIGFGPRHECSQTEMAVHSCYMYRPTKPLVIAPNKGDRRPLAPAMLACRTHAIRVAEGEYVARKDKGGVLVYFAPGGGDPGGRAAAPDGDGGDGDGDALAAGVGRR